MSKNKLQTLKGFRDFLPKEARRRQYALDVIRETFEVYGFEPLETPALEYASLLLGKYGEEADRLVYTFEDKGGRKVGLRYDQTVPTARVLAQYQELPKPFRRYQIQNAWRSEKPQSGRYREFLQCDADIFGSTSPLSAAEVIVTAATALANLGLKGVTVLINDREVLFNMIKDAGVTEEMKFSVIQTLDKLDKKSEADVKTELKKKGLNDTQVEKLFDLIDKAVPTENLEKVIDASARIGMGETKIEFRPFLARGLDYYTGTIFEFVVEGGVGGSVGGGGRYDKLIESLSGQSIPAVGFALGFDRIVETMEKFGLFPKDFSATEVLVTVFNQDTFEASAEVASLLRGEGINTELYPDTETKLDKQIKYADKKGVSFVVVIGPDEAESKSVTIKNMQTGSQETVETNNLLKWFKDQYK